MAKLVARGISGEISSEGGVEPSWQRGGWMAKLVLGSERDMWLSW